MPPRLQPFRPLFQSLVLICLLLAGCGSRDAGGPAAASGPDAGAGENAGSGWSEALPKVTAQPGQSVHVGVHGGSETFNADLASMLTGYLQSDRGLTPADATANADIVVRVRVENIRQLDSRSAPASGGRALGTPATGAVLGAMLGGAMGGGRGAAWGVGGGALLGLGIGLTDGGSYNVWGLEAQVGFGRNGREPADDAWSRVRVTAEGENMGREASQPGLEDALSRKIVDALQP